jgi:hypothetical protein
VDVIYRVRNSEYQWDDDDPNQRENDRERILYYTMLSYVDYQTIL